MGCACWPGALVITAIAITSLALGIGANTAIFTVAKAALFDALAVPHPEQLQLLAYAQDDHSVIANDWGDFYTDARGRTVLASFSWPVYRADCSARSQSLGELFAFADLDQFEHLSATIDGHAEVVTAELVSGNFFQAMGVRTVLGRSIEPADDAVPGSGAVAVISDSFWQRHFARSPDCHRQDDRRESDTGDDHRSRASRIYGRLARPDASGSFHADQHAAGDLSSTRRARCCPMRIPGGFRS